jgi:hypothetical protein
VRRLPATLACLAFGGGAVLATVTAGPEVTGCTTHQCDQSSYGWFPYAQLVDGGDGGHVPGQGFMLDEDTYVTNGINDEWLPFHGNTTVKLWFPAEVAGRQAEIPVVAVGTDDAPNSAESGSEGANYTTGVGQLAIFNELNTNLTYEDGGRVRGDGGVGDATVAGYVCDGGVGCIYGGSVLITNSSCADYFMHVEVHFASRDVGTASNGAQAVRTDAEVDSAASAGMGVDAAASAPAEAGPVNSGSAGAD